MKLKWPDFTFGPINLFNSPRLSLKERIVLRKRVDIVIEDMQNVNAHIRAQRLAELENLYYLRTGKII